MLKRKLCFTLGMKQRDVSFPHDVENRLECLPSVRKEDVR